MSGPTLHRDRVGSIPAQQIPLLVHHASASDQIAPKPYRSSVCSSLSTPDSPSHPVNKKQPLISQSQTSPSSISASTSSLVEDEQDEPVTASSDDDDDHENDEDEHSTVASTSCCGSYSSSVNSSKSSLRDEAERQQDDSQQDKMLSLDNFSNSSSSASLPVPAGDAPDLPPRSARRASRMLGSIPQKKTVDDEQPMLPHAAPHQIYLSSEEDASSSADDFSDFGDVESDAEISDKKTSDGRFGRGDTARVVSVVFYGKPSMITLSRRSISPSSSDASTSAGILRTATEPALSRPRSDSSASSSSAFRHPPRSTSMMTTALEKKRPEFLHIDPYATISDDQGSARSPMTPTAMLRRTLNLVKKRSRASLYQSESPVTPMEQVGEQDGEGEADDPRESLCLEPATPLSAISYEDIIKSAKRSVSSPKSPKSRFRAGLSLGRQRSVKA